MDHDYTVEVYCDAIDMGYRTLESIPEEYLEDVRKCLQSNDGKPRRKVFPQMTQDSVIYAL